MNSLRDALTKLGLLKDDLDYHLTGASMVIILLFFGYQKWFEYDAQALIPYVSNGRLIFWMYPVFGIRGATYFLGAAEWLFGGLLFLSFWNKNLGILGALGLYHYRHDYPVYAGWLGCVCRRVPRYDGESCIPNEGSPVPSVAAGRNECGFSGSRQFEASRTWPT